MVLTVQDFAGGIVQGLDPAAQILKGLNAREKIQGAPLRQQQLQQNFDIGEQAQQLNAQKIQAFEQQQLQQQQAQALEAQQQQKFQQMELELEVFTQTRPLLASMRKLAPDKAPGDRKPEGDEKRKVNAEAQKAQAMKLWFQLKAMSDDPKFAAIREDIIDTARDVKEQIINENDPDIRKANIKGIMNFGDDIRKKLEAEDIIKPKRAAELEKQFDPFAQEKIDARNRALDIKAARNKVLKENLSRVDGKRLDFAQEQSQVSRTKSFRMRALAAKSSQRIPELLDDSGLVTNIAEYAKRLFGQQDAESLLRLNIEEILGTESLVNLPKGTSTDRDIEIVRAGFPENNSHPEVITKWLEARARLADLDTEYQDFVSEYIFEHHGQGGMNPEWRRRINAGEIATVQRSKEAFGRPTAIKRNLTDEELNALSDEEFQQMLVSDVEGDN